MSETDLRRRQRTHLGKGYTVVIRTSLLACLALAASCGGATATGPGGNSAPGTASNPGGVDGQSGGDPAASAEPEARCQDDSCFACGDGLCPRGFYCDRQAPGGAACSWLPECAQSATCECLSQVLGAACSCTEEGGGTFCQ